MGLVRLGLAGAAGYAIARKVANKNNPTPNNTRDMSEHPSYRDTKSGYMHQSYCNGQCGRMCNGQQTHGLHDWSCNGQCGGQCATQRQSGGVPSAYTAGPGEAQGYYAAGGLGQRQKEALPSYESTRAAPASMAAAGGVKV